MLTPRFELSQTNEELTVKVYAPYANIKDTEVYVEGKDFRFFSSPYYLRLVLPGEIIENDNSSGSYDCDAGLFVLKFSKVNPNEHFENLDMITTLLSPPREKKNIVPTIEVIGNPAVTDQIGLDNDSNSNEEKVEKAENNDWFVPQTVPVQANTAIDLLMSPKYGFANKISGALGSFEEGWLKDVVELPFPDITPITERRRLREADEKQHFSDEHYTADLIQPEDSLKLIINFVPETHRIKDSEAIEFTDLEKDVLKEMPNKEFLLTPEETKIALMSLVDILYSYCYNHRVTMGENTSESCWDINKISSTLSWFDSFTSLDEVLQASFRRSLCYPLYRHWDLSQKVLGDVKAILKHGKKMVVKSLCEIYGLFNNSYEPRYLLNQLYIKDYIIWTQKLPVSMIASIAGDLDGVKVEKKDLNLDLVELEAAAWSVLDEEDEDDQNKGQCHYKNINFKDSSEVLINSIVHGVNKLMMNANDIELAADDSDDNSTSSDSSSSSASVVVNHSSSSSDTSSSASDIANDSSSSSDTSSSSESETSSSSDCESCSSSSEEWSSSPRSQKVRFKLINNDNFDDFVDNNLNKD